MNLGLENKVALVTGASRGIGAAVARQLSAQGCSMVVTARSTDALAALTADIEQAGGQALACAVDLRDRAGAAQLVAATLARFGRLDLIVANAGSAKAGDFLSLTDDDWEDGFALKFFGHMRLARAAWPHLIGSAGGVIFIAGFAGRTPPPDATINGSINGALLSLTKALANRGREDGVRVNAINPGQIRTQRFEQRVRALIEAEGINAVAAERKMARDYGMTRTGNPEDVADLVSFIASERATFLHGALIDLDGGMTKTV